MKAIMVSKKLEFQIYTTSYTFGKISLPFKTVRQGSTEQNWPILNHDRKNSRIEKIEDLGPTHIVQDQTIRGSLLTLLS